ncbi:MAG: glycosyltransferase [Actinomycetota bacterium]
MTKARRSEDKRVLMVSYNYPPVGAIGAVRTTKLARYLPDSGWRPTVLTVSRDRTKWSGGELEEGALRRVRVIRAPFPDILTMAKEALTRLGLVKDTGRPDEPAAPGGATRGGTARRLFSATRRWAAFPDRYLLWVPFAMVKGLIELRKADYGAIYSTSPPVSGHIVAAALSRLSGVPWVADLRDPWRHPYIDFSPLQDRIDARLERLVLRRASALVTVSEPLADELLARNGPRPCGVACITNGFDPVDAGEGAPPSSDRFVLTYTGALFGLRQDPAPLLETLDGLASEGSIDPGRVLVRFFGPREPGLDALIGGLAYPGMVEVCGVVPRGRALEAQRESTVLLVLLWDEPYTAKIYGGKALEYLGAGRPILAWNPSGGIIGDLLWRTGAGKAVCDREELHRVLLEWYGEFERTGTVAFRGTEPEIERYSWESLAGEMSSIIDCVAGVEHPGS